ncbi:MAG: lactate utilization protein [Candidatus Rokubacteria bacterium]|nr:lactate utilization protein [Candidatus Rokubacteria bacterium]MBI3826577.1 lactate utilization protein [Candidatus Rokubacteria bacterium]
MTTRAEFLGEIRREMAKTPGAFPATPALRPARPAEVAETIRRELAERWPETLERFRQEFERVGGVFYRVGSIDAVPGVVGRIAREREARRLVAWHPSALGRDLVPPLRSEGLDGEAMPPGALDDPRARQALRERIAAADLGLTGVDLAIAETGSLVLVSGAGRPRSTSLLPPYHVAVFDRTALVESLAQVGVLLEAWHAGEAPAGRGAAINVITGPSRTADIELTLTRGVHGPKEVHAIFVEAPWRG